MLKQNLKLSSLPLLALLLLLGSCGRQPAQDYAVTGTLTLPQNVNQRFQELARNRIGFDLVMTARTSPRSGDIVIQRRWEHVSMPFEFGLGKGRGEYFSKKADGLYITAYLECRSKSFPMRMCGFTAKAVPVGTSHINLALDADPKDESIYARPGAPVGGWSSPSVMEEAMPPGRTAKPLGAMAFAGEIRVPEHLNRSLQDWNLRIMARERADRGFPELILAVPNPTFPLAFSLHQNHRMAGGDDPVVDPKYVVIVLDRDGMVDTNDDQVSVATAEQVEVGADDLIFKLPGAELQRLLEKNATSQPSSRPASRPVASGNNDPQPKTPAGALVAEGTIDLPTDQAAAAVGATLWLSIRDAATNQSLMFKRVSDFSFPYAFSIKNGEGDMGMSVKAGAQIVVRAILTKTGDPLDKGAFVGQSQPGKTGMKNARITLARP